MTEQKDAWDRLHITAGVIGSVLIPIALFYAGNSLSESERTNAALQAKASNMIGLIPHLASKNEMQRMIAVEVALNMSIKEQLPPELVTTIARIAVTDKSSAVAQVSTQTALNAAKQDPVSEKIIQEAFKGIKPRVYFHIPGDALRDAASEASRKLQKNLANEGFVITVPSINVRKGPRTNELRFFKTSEEDEAMKILDGLKSVGVEAKLVNKSADYENATNIRPLHFELFYGIQDLKL